jgi:hypothetical protein
MKKLSKGAITFLFCAVIGNSAFADKGLCIALTNYSPSAVEFSGIADPGYVYTVQQKDSATLSGDHMAGSCFGDSCAVSIYALDGSTPKGMTINHLPRGTRIIYGGPNQYYSDVHAKVKCSA